MSKLLRILLIVYHAWLVLQAALLVTMAVLGNRKSATHCKGLSLYLHISDDTGMVNKSIDVYASFVIALTAEPELTHLMTMMEKTLAQTPKTTMAARM